jgi:hypothetical protein
MPRRSAGVLRLQTRSSNEFVLVRDFDGVRSAIVLALTLLTALSCVVAVLLHSAAMLFVAVPLFIAAASGAALHHLTRKPLSSSILWLERAPFGAPERIRTSIELNLRYLPDLVTIETSFTTGDSVIATETVVIGRGEIAKRGETRLVRFTLRCEESDRFELRVTYQPPSRCSHFTLKRQKAAEAASSLTAN